MVLNNLIKNMELILINKSDDQKMFAQISDIKIVTLGQIVKGKQEIVIHMESNDKGAIMYSAMTKEKALILIEVLNKLVLEMI